MTLWTCNISISLLIQLFLYHAILLFIISVISVFRFISSQPSRDPHPFLFGSPASSAAVALTVGKDPLKDQVYLEPTP